MLNREDKIGEIRKTIYVNGTTKSISIWVNCTDIYNISPYNSVIISYESQTYVVKRGDWMEEPGGV